MAGDLKPKIETVTPTAMMPLEELDGDALLIRVGQIGRRCVINLAEDSRYLSKFCDKLDQGDLWRKVALTWDEFCQKAFGYPGYYVETIRAGVALLDKGDGKPISAEDARKAVMAKMVEKVAVSPQHGGDRTKEQDRLPTLLKGDRASEYLVARIKRDRPDIAERMVKGEFKSVNAAAREAGINVRPTVKLGDPERVAQSICRLQGQEYINALIQALEKLRINH